jgi:WD40 repeat protein
MPVSRRSCLIVFSMCCVVACSYASVDAQSTWMPAAVDKPELFDPQMKVQAIAFSPDSKQLIVGGMRKGATLALFTGELLWWTIGGDDEIRHRRLSEAIYRLAPSPDGKRVVAAAGSLQLWSGGGEFEKTLRGHPMLPGRIGFSADSSVVASGGERLEFFDAEKGTVLWSVADYNAVTALALAPDGRDCAATQVNGRRTISLFHVDKRTKSTLGEHDARITQLAWLGPKAIAAGDDKGQVRVWNVDSGELLRKIDAHKTPVLWLAVSADGATIATGDGTAIKLWNAATGEIGATLAGDGPLVFSTNGKLLAARNGDKIALWPRAGASTADKQP